MAGSPQKRARREAAEAAAELRAAEAKDGVRLDRHGNPLMGAAGRPMTEETKERLRIARQNAAEKRRLEQGKERFTNAQIRDHAMGKLWPKAYKVMEMALDGAIERGVADRDAINAAFKLFEQRFGKPTQRVEAKQEQVTKIIYEAAPFVFENNSN